MTESNLVAKAFVLGLMLTSIKQRFCHSQHIDIESKDINNNNLDLKPKPSVVTVDSNPPPSPSPQERLHPLNLASTSQ